MKRIDLDKIQKKYWELKPRGSTEDAALSLLFHSYGLLTCTLQEEKVNDQYDYQSLAKQHFIVDLVIVIETYFKNKIVQKTDWVKEGYSDLLSESITLSKAYELLADREDPVTKEFIIAQSQSFQNLQNINRVFSLLTGTAFLLRVEEVNIARMVAGIPKSSFKDNYPTWRSDIGRIFDMRHAFIHDGTYTELSNDQTEDYFNLALLFITTVESYFTGTENRIYDSIIQGLIINVIGLAGDQRNKNLK